MSCQLDSTIVSSSSIIVTLMMAVFSILCVFFASVIPVLSARAKDLCTSDWELDVDGIDVSELTIHHSSTSLPEEFTHLVWHWRWEDYLSGTTWLSQNPKSGKFDGGFISQPKSMLHLPASFVWSLANKSLGVSTHGDPTELSSYPAWSLSVCQGNMKWGVSANKDLFITYGGYNETRSLDESWAVDGRLKRQAEFPLPQERPMNNSTIAAWIRRFLNTIGNPQDDNSRSWVWDLTELLFRLIFSSVRGHTKYPESVTLDTVSPDSLPEDSDSEFPPATFSARDIEPVTESYRPFRFPKHITQPAKT